MSGEQDCDPRHTEVRTRRSDRQGSNDLRPLTYIARRQSQGLAPKFLRTRPNGGYRAAGQGSHEDAAPVLVVFIDRLLGATRLPWKSHKLIALRIEDADTGAYKRDRQALHLSRGRSAGAYQRIDLPPYAHNSDRKRFDCLDPNKYRRPIPESTIKVNAS